MFSKVNNKSKNEFVTYTKYLSDERLKQIKQFKTLKPKLEQLIQIDPNGKNDENNMQIGTETDSQMEYPSKDDHQNWIKLDERAFIINNNLVYIQDEKPRLETSEQIIRFLKDNKIRIKDFIHGNRKKILQEILQNYEKQQIKQIQKYINKNMKKQEQFQLQFEDWYHEAKQSIFEN